MVSIAATVATLTGGTANATENCPIALTFDDGPGPYTNQVVDALAAHGARATFFMVGNRMQTYSGAAQHVVATGNQLGNHSWQHDQLTLKSAQAAADDINRTQASIAAVTGVTPLIMRPPYGETNNAIVAAVGMPEILWSIDTRDWATHNTQSTINSVISNAHCGAIVLMHDIHSSTAAAVWPILDNLQSRGFSMVTVQDLIGTPPTGRYYHQ